MAFKLTKKEMVTRDQIVAALREKGGGLEEAISTFNTAFEEAWGAVDAALTEYNDALAEAKEFTDEIHGDRQNEYDEKSEKWQEGERGEIASSWLGEWEGIDLSEIEIEKPDEIDVPDLSHADDLEGLPEMAE